MPIPIPIPIPIQVTAAMAVDREFVNIVLARRPSNGDPKLPRSTRLSLKPLKSMPWDHSEAPKVNLGVPRSKKAPKVYSRRRSSCFGLPLYTSKAPKYSACLQNRAARNPRDTAHTAHTAGHSAHRRISDTSSAAQSPLSTHAGGKDDGG